MFLRFSVFILLAFSASTLPAWAITPGCDCPALAKSCGPQSEDSISHISWRHPNCSLEELRACGMDYGLKIKSVIAKANNRRSRLFVETLSKEAPALMELYKGHVTPREYTELAAVAFGIMGNESSYYSGFWYRVKQVTPEWAIKSWKCFRRSKEHCKMDLSYGPTQIKPDSIPELVAKKYGVSPQSLYSRPDHAAVATMAVLIEWKENLYQMKEKYSSLSGLDATTYADYIPYFYQGKGARPLYRMEMPNPADRSRNGYLYNIREYRDSLRIIEYSCSSEQIVDQVEFTDSNATR